MNLSLYISNDAENVINKVLTFKHETAIKLKETVNISSPIIVLSEIEGVDLLQCNYCFLSKFERYYFIRDIEVSKSVYVLYLECDVLESFKNDILNSECEYSRIVEQGDFMNFSTVDDVRKEIDIYSNDIELNLSKNIILSTIGGK